MLESNFLEIFPVTTEATKAYKRVEQWAKPEGVPFDFNTFAMRGKVIKDPQGVVLIIGPFNYPLVRYSCLSLPWASQSPGNPLQLRSGVF